MNRIIGIIFVLVFSSGIETTAQAAQSNNAGHQSAEEKAVLEAMDSFMTAVSESDYAAWAAMQVPDSLSFQWRPKEGGGMHITSHPHSYWSDPSRGDGRDYRERYWSPSVMIRGGIAVVWAPYEFWIDGETSHCGVDVLDFVKIDGVWLVANAMWTVEPEACGELRAVDDSVIRPTDQ